MASEEHKQLAKFIKEVHSSLRKSFLKHGFEKAWRDHCKNESVLEKYAESMEKLALTHWEINCNDHSSLAISRIKWTVNLCYNYFLEKSCIQYREKELNICNKIGITTSIEECFSYPIKLIDVGSCYNPFKVYDYFDVLAIDLCPANSHVYRCDFLNVLITSDTKIVDQKVIQLAQNSFDVATFCFLLEYIPTSELRIAACEKAYHILKPGGLLIINTPDSKHIGANCKLMKCWRYTLACIGFNRIVYEKFKHMHSMAFRKSLYKDTAVRWADIHKESYMEYSMNIPQDFNTKNEKCTYPNSVEVSIDDFQELPFSDCFE